MPAGHTNPDAHTHDHIPDAHTHDHIPVTDTHDHVTVTDTDTDRHDVDTAAHRPSIGPGVGPGGEFVAQFYRWRCRERFTFADPGALTEPDALAL